MTYFLDNLESYEVRQGQDGYHTKLEQMISIKLK